LPRLRPPRRTLLKEVRREMSSRFPMVAELTFQEYYAGRTLSNEIDGFVNSTAWAFSWDKSSTCHVRRGCRAAFPALGA